MSVKEIIFNKDKFARSAYPVPDRFIVRSGSFLTGDTAGGFANCRPTKDLMFDCEGVFYDKTGFIGKAGQAWYIFDKAIKPDENNTHHTVGYGPAYAHIEDCTPIFENGG